MKWLPLDSEDNLLRLRNLSESQPVLVFKHSTRCGISSTALNRLEREWNDSTPIQPYLLDLLKHRELSRGIAQLFDVEHQSPQVILIHHGKAIYNSSHLDIRYRDVIKAAESITS
ncbi:MAG: bacillithiol system redox-active protein YtxJ [Cyclobacteriaceae bacterium]|jgi:bacillithiol system protein YtxJ|nr:bacillithiol system redox-active protein YtxJ [Cytophagales bacterium]HNP75849.1 bacillithiol system redox-active protein YtxJ [Cyclobacteriaceae bacterium]